jgi:hypothetical protein
MREQLKWYDDKTDNSPWIDALAELRQRAAREGYCYQHVQAITVAIDQYAEKALGNRDYLLNKPTASAKRNAVPAVSTSGIRSLWAGSLFSSLGLPRIIGRGATSRGRVGWQPTHPRWHVRNGVAAGARATCKQA